LSDMSTFPRIDRKVLNSLQEMLLKEIPRIIAHVAGVVNDGPGGNRDEDVDEGTCVMQKRHYLYCNILVENHFSKYFHLDEAVLLNQNLGRHREVFTMAESLENKQRLVLFGGVFMALLVLVAALVIASVVNDHKVLEGILQHWMNYSNSNSAGNTIGDIVSEAVDVVVD